MDARPRVVIFLDIDGVLAPFPMPFVVAKGRIFPDENVAALSSLVEALDAMTRVDVVLSSTWRVQPSYCRDILNDFRLYGRHSPLASLEFHDVTDPALHTERQHEIYDWLVRQTNETPIAAWICLDDEELIHGEVNARHKSYFEGHVIHCDSKKGLTRAQATEAIQLIQRQLDNYQTGSV